MIYSLTGTVRKLLPPQLVVEVRGIGYLVSVPHPVWESATDGVGQTLVTYTYVREDRLDLYGFATGQERTLFIQLINLSGIGPKIALEICSIPRNMLTQAIAMGDSGMLTKVKGIGKKTAEKLLVDLQSLYEKHPDALVTGETGDGSMSDADAIAALMALGYDQMSAMQALRKLPANLTKTEDRITAVLRSK